MAFLGGPRSIPDGAKIKPVPDGAKVISGSRGLLSTLSKAQESIHLELPVSREQTQFQQMVASAVEKEAKQEFDPSIADLTTLGNSAGQLLRQLASERNVDVQTIRRQFAASLQAEQSSAAAAPPSSSSHVESKTPDLHSSRKSSRVRSRTTQNNDATGKGEVGEERRKTKNVDPPRKSKRPHRPRYAPVDESESTDSDSESKPKRGSRQEDSDDEDWKLQDSDGDASDSTSDKDVKQAPRPIIHGSASSKRVKSKNTPIETMRTKKTFLDSAEPLKFLRSSQSSSQSRSRAAKAQSKRVVVTPPSLSSSSSEEDDDNTASSSDSEQEDRVDKKTRISQKALQKMVKKYASKTMRKQQSNELDGPTKKSKCTCCNILLAILGLMLIIAAGLCCLMFGQSLLAFFVKIASQQSLHQTFSTAPPHPSPHLVKPSTGTQSETLTQQSPAPSETSPAAPDYVDESSLNVDGRDSPIERSVPVEPQVILFDKSIVLYLANLTLAQVTSVSLPEVAQALDDGKLSLPQINMQYLQSSKLRGLNFLVDRHTAMSLASALYIPTKEVYWTIETAKQNASQRMFMQESAPEYSLSAIVGEYDATRSIWCRAHALDLPAYCNSSAQEDRLVSKEMTYPSDLDTTIDVASDMGPCITSLVNNGSWKLLHEPNIASPNIAKLKVYGMHAMWSSLATCAPGDPKLRDRVMSMVQTLDVGTYPLLHRAATVLAQ